MIVPARWKNISVQLKFYATEKLATVARRTAPARVEREKNIPRHRGGLRPAAILLILLLPGPVRRRCQL